MQQECIWPRAILCISTAQALAAKKIAALAGLKARLFYGADIFPATSGKSPQSYFDITHSQIGAGSPAMIARQIQKEFGAGVRIGLSVNAPLAQYAASQSLAGIPYVIAPWKIYSELGQISLAGLPFIQKNLYQRLQLHGLETVSQFVGLNRQDIQRRFGLRGVKLLDLLNGRDYFTHKTVADVSLKHITEYLVLPPNSSGRKLILRYIKQLVIRLVNVAREQNKSGKTVQLTIIVSKKKCIYFVLAVNDFIDSQSVFKKLTESLAVRNFTEIILALELKLVDTSLVSGQEELPLECFG